MINGTSTKRLLLIIIHFSYRSKLLFIFIEMNIFKSKLLFFVLPATMLLSAAKSNNCSGPIIHTDTTYGYQVTVPSWLRILETPEDVYGGLFPKTDTVENTVLFKSFKKDQFKTLDAFENWVVKDYSVGQESRWDPDHIILLKNQLNDYTGPGDAFRVQILNEGFISNCCYVLLETHKAFVWIDFSATRETYSVNLPKFMEIVNSVKII
jgi:hypothetical protein